MINFLLPDPKTECDIVFKSMDLDNSKKIMKTEFSSWFGRKLKGIKGQHATKIESAMRKLFTKFDSDNNNSIDRNEFTIVFN